MRRCGIHINAVTKRKHAPSAKVSIVMLETHYTSPTGRHRDLDSRGALCRTLHSSGDRVPCRVHDPCKIIYNSGRTTCCQAHFDASVGSFCCARPHSSGDLEQARDSRGHTTINSGWRVHRAAESSDRCPITTGSPWPDHARPTASPWRARSPPPSVSSRNC